MLVFTHSNLTRFATVLSLPVENQADDTYPPHTCSHAELRKRFCHKRREAFTHHLLSITLTGRRIWLSVLQQRRAKNPESAVRILSASQKDASRSDDTRPCLDKIGVLSTVQL